MSDLHRKLVEAAQQTVDLQEALTNIFMEQYRLRKQDEPKPGYSAYGLMAVDVSLRIANAFLAVKHDKGVHRVLTDFTYQLNTNEFWQKNASVLMPIIHLVLNTHRDGVILQADRAQRNEYSTNDALISASRAAPLEIFPVIAYLLGGPELMVSTSIPLKLALAPYFLS